MLPLLRLCNTISRTFQCQPHPKWSARRKSPVIPNLVLSYTYLSRMRSHSRSYLPVKQLRRRPHEQDFYGTGYKIQLFHLISLRLSSTGKYNQCDQVHNLMLIDCAEKIKARLKFFDFLNSHRKPIQKLGHSLLKCSVDGFTVSELCRFF